MSLTAVKILKISITTNSKKEILEEIRKYLFKTQNSELKTQKNVIIFTPNAEQIVLAQKNKEFQEILNRADVAIPDSTGVVWASGILVKNGPRVTIPGVEFMEDLVRLAATHHVPIGLIGGRGNLAIETLDCLRKKYPGLMTSENPRIIFVALGAPKQEEYIGDAAKKTTGVVYMAVGGSFDIISGRLARAPLFMRNIGLEWLWRLILEPWRIFRQLALAEFVGMVLQERLALMLNA